MLPLPILKSVIGVNENGFRCVHHNLLSYVVREEQHPDANRILCIMRRHIRNGWRLDASGHHFKGLGLKWEGLTFNLDRKIAP